MATKQVPIMSGLLEYTQNSSTAALTGIGKNGKFKCTKAGDYSSLSVNGVSCSIMDAPISLVNNRWYIFVLDGNSLSFLSAGNSSGGGSSGGSSSDTELFGGQPPSYYATSADLATKAPTAHASTATTYGIGTSSNYGHVKLSDATNSTSAATAGIAASPKAVKTAYDLANTANTTAAAALPKTGGTVSGATTFSGTTTMSGAVSITNTTASTSTSTGALKVSGGVGVAGKIYGSSVYGAVWNDYAEYRNQGERIEPGYCVTCGDDGFLWKTDFKLSHCEGVVSDTFGFAIGETDFAQTPVAVSGRVLAYVDGNRGDYHAGDVVCAGPNGRVCKMSREEIAMWPDRIVGVVSEIPNYEIWGTGKVKVNGRIWIKV